MKNSLIRWRFLLHLLSPPFAPPRTVIFCRFLRAWGKQKIPISLGNQDFTIFCFSSKWCHQESNRGHKDFQSFALPTELWHRYFSPHGFGFTPRFRLGLQRYAIIFIIQIILQKSSKKSYFCIDKNHCGGAKKEVFQGYLTIKI